MSLVAYSSSEDEGDEEDVPAHPAKKRRLSHRDGKKASDLPPLPSSFLDQYSSTVRTSTQDDPSLHGGRKRVTPHVAGNWPAHVYLEWSPKQEEVEVLSRLIAVAATEEPAPGIYQSSQIETKELRTISRPDRKVHSLLQSDLGVPLPLHISLSRPLVLRTDQKEAFLQNLAERLNTGGGSEAFTVLFDDLVWHPNESNTRWFLVLRLASPMSDGLGGVKELRKLLLRCNDVAKRFEQPMLYTSELDPNSKVDAKWESEHAHSSQDHFHISLAWSLAPPMSNIATDGRAVAIENQHKLLEQLRSIDFAEVKVRIGQDVHRIPLKKRRH